MSDVHFRKCGLLFELPRDLGWATSHAAIPTPDRLDDGSYHIYFSARDGANRASIGRFRVRVVGDELRIVEVEREPVLGLGERGTFDDGGVTVSCLVTNSGVKYLYFTGWSLGVSVPFYLFAGLAVSEDGGVSFRRASQAPILERNNVDPYLTASPYVLVENNLWRMWYVSGTCWELHEGSPRHRYHIRYAESDDGVHWKRDGHVALDYRDEHEYALARPFIFPVTGGYEMWFSHRGAAYHLGRARSADGRTWTRDGASLLELSAEGWDSEMLAYPACIEVDGRRFLLYNGNGYGATGIGYAVTHSI